MRRGFFKKKKRDKRKRIFTEDVAQLVIDLEAPPGRILDIPPPMTREEAENYAHEYEEPENIFLPDLIDLGEDDRYPISDFEEDLRILTPSQGIVKPARISTSANDLVDLNIAPLSVKEWKNRLEKKLNDNYKKTKSMIGKFYVVKDNKTGVLYQGMSYNVAEDDISEALRIYSNTNHPNILNYHQTIVSTKLIWVICEHSKGAPLAQFTGQNCDWGAQAASYVCLQVLRALVYLNGNGIMHGALCADNVHVCATGEIKLSGFTAARQVTPDLTTAINPLLQYMPPEMVRGEPYGTAVDIWCLGIMLIHVLEGRPPLAKLSGKNLKSALNKRKRAPKLQDPDSWDESISEFLSLCLAMDVPSRESAGVLLSHEYVLDYLPRNYFVDFLEECKVGITF